MNELQIARAILLRATQRYPASSKEAKELLDWARDQAWLLLGLKRKEASALRWTALRRGLAEAGGTDGDPCPTLALAGRLADILTLDEVDRRIALILVALDRSGLVSDLGGILRRHGQRLPVVAGEVAGLEAYEAERRVRMNPLVRHGLVRFRADWRGEIDVELGWSMATLLDRLPQDDDGIVEAMVGPRHSGGLPLDAFSHVGDAGFLVRLLAGARSERASGINILIHGPPGTGKTELARRLAAEAGLSLFGVGEATPDGYEPDRDDRIGALELGHRLLAQRDAALIFDEMEDLIGGAEMVRGAVRGRSGSKVFVNRLLESNPVPVIWTTNTIGNVDDAILRRMSFVLHLGYPRRKAALAMLDRIGAEEGVAPTADLQQLAETASETATVMRVAARSTRLAGEGDGGLRPAASLVRAIRGEAVPHPAPGAVDLALYEGDRPIGPLFARLAEAGHADISILLTGPPGTGKTALAHHFARMVDRPLLVKRASDLLSKWVGETEANIAAAFAEAREDEAVLLFDEADSLMFDRSTAQNSWEVGQVNELLTWLDRHPYPVIAATNNDARLDPATKRRFIYKLHLGPLGREAAARAFERFFARPAPGALAGIDRLTPGDFAVVARQLRHEPGLDDAALVARLAAEVAAKGEAPGRIGF